MFRLHETTRRRVCRLAFVLACAVPTLATISWIAYGRRPWRVLDAQAELSGILHANVRLTDWRQPRPGTVRTSLLSIADRGAAASSFDATDVTSRESGNRRTISIRRLTLDADAVGATLGQACNWLTRDQCHSLALSVGELVVESRDAPQKVVFREVEVRAELGSNGSWKARLAASPAEGGEVVQAAIECAQTDSQATVRATIDATTMELPAWLLAAAAPMLRPVGEDATFLGTVQLEFVGGVLSGGARGELHGIPLATMLPAGSPCRADGVADLSIAELRWRGERTERLVGSLRAQQVQVNRGLLDAAATHLLCGLFGVGSAAPADAAEMVAIDILACRFEFDQQGFTLWGDLPDDANYPPGCVAVSGGAPLLMQPARAQLPAGCWVQFVAGPSSNWMPATQEAVGVAERLPLPSAVASEITR